MIAAAAQRPCGFVVVLLRAIGLADVTVRPSLWLASRRWR
jgi:hypothetical protein